MVIDFRINVPLTLTNRISLSFDISRKIGACTVSFDTRKLYLVICKYGRDFCLSTPVQHINRMSK